MAGSIQVLREELTLSDDQAQLMDIVLRESNRLNGTIRSFLDYARPQPAAVERLDLARIVADTAMLLRRSRDLQAGHAIDVDVPADPVWFEADEGHVSQILWNLATNGLRAMPSSGRLRIAVAAEPASPAHNGATVAMTAPSVVIDVQDEGVGIPPEELDGIFQPFRGTFAHGSGLGLAIVHRIVSDYNGEIHVTSAVGQGTTVRVRLRAGTGARTGTGTA